MSYGSGKYTYELEDGWAKLPEGESTFFDVPDIHIDARDMVYITTRGVHPVMLFDPGGKLVHSAEEGSFGFPIGSNRASRHGLCVGHDGSIYVASVRQHIVSKYTLEGQLLLQMGTKDHPSDSGLNAEAKKDPNNVVKRGAPPFNGPTDISLGASGEIYVSDGYFNASIHKFNPDGKLLLSWGEPGTGPGQFRIPHSVWIDKQQQVWICDRDNNRIQIFDNNGKFLNQLTEFKQPCTLWIDGEGIVYVAELQKRISILDSKGSVLTRFSAEDRDKNKALFAPHGIAVDSKGNIYVGEVSHGSPDIFDMGTRGLQKLQRFVKKTSSPA